MSPRYEYADWKTPLEIVPSGADAEESGLDLDDGNYGLVIGDPWATAYVVEGPAEQLWAFIIRLARLAENMLPWPASRAAGWPPGLAAPAKALAAGPAEEQDRADRE